MIKRDAKFMYIVQRASLHKRVSKNRKESPQEFPGLSSCLYMSQQDFYIFVFQHKVSY